MSKFTLAVASSIIGAVAIAGSVRQAVAEQEHGTPSDEFMCYYRGYFCSYPGTAYWSDCDPGYGPGYISTQSAKKVCQTFHYGTVE